MAGGTDGGQAWLASGPDLGGSLRIPAAFFGVVGMRRKGVRCPDVTLSCPEEEELHLTKDAKHH